MRKTQQNKIPENENASASDWRTTRLRRKKKKKNLKKKRAKVPDAKLPATGAEVNRKRVLDTENNLPQSGSLNEMICDESKQEIRDESAQ